MTYVLVDRPDLGIVVITLNRPERMNAMAFDVMVPFRAALQEAGEDPSVRAVVVTGAGRGIGAAVAAGLGAARGRVSRRGQPARAGSRGVGGARPGASDRSEGWWCAGGGLRVAADAGCVWGWATRGHRHPQPPKPKSHKQCHFCVTKSFSSDVSAIP